MHSNPLQLGGWHIPVFGVLEAIGVVAALALSQRTAKAARLDANAVWNAGTTMVVAAFVSSRLLFAVFNWHSFLQFPVLSMAFASLTSTGSLLTGFFMLAYLRWARLPLVPFLDAMAPCAALLWMFLSVGRMVEGTRDGMPTRAFWGVSDGMAMRVHPVELYTLVSAAAICLVLLQVIEANGPAGTTVGTGLGLAGSAIYVVDLFRVPSDLLVNAWLDPAQTLAIAMIVAGCVLYHRVQATIQGTRDVATIDQTTLDQATKGNEGRDAV